MSWQPPEPWEPSQDSQSGLQITPADKLAILAGLCPMCRSSARADTRHVSLRGAMAVARCLVCGVQWWIP